MLRIVPSLEEAFSGVRDFRHPQGRRYKLQGVLVLACLAMAHGAQTEQAIAKWSESQGKKWLSLLGMRRHRGPSMATIQRIFKGIDRDQLDAAMELWSKSLISASVVPCSISDFMEFNNEQNTLTRLGQWVEVVVCNLPKVEDESLIESQEALNALEEMNAQGVGEGGLKIWAVDYD